MFKAQGICSFQEDRNEDAVDIVFQMICITIKCRFLNLISFAGFCSSLIFIFSIIWTIFPVVPMSPDNRGSTVSFIYFPYYGNITYLGPQTTDSKIHTRL